MAPHSWCRWSSSDGVFGSVTLAARQRSAFDDTDVEVAAELARPLASAIEQRRLLARAAAGPRSWPR